jgi:hypothetical protein
MNFEALLVIGGGAIVVGALLYFPFFLWFRWRGSRVKGFVKPKDTDSLASDPMAGVRWVPASESPFGVDLLDCRSFSQTMCSMTLDLGVITRYGRLRGSTGEEYRGRSPENAKTCECNLQYPNKAGTRDGPIFKAEVMEDKWDIYLYDGYLYFTKSWSGELEYRARFEIRGYWAKVVTVEARKELVESDSFYPVAVVDYLIRSHLYRLPIPHPLPKSIGQNPYDLTLFSFTEYGRHGLFGAFGDTTRLQVPAQVETGVPAVV